MCNTKTIQEILFLLYVKLPIISSYDSELLKLQSSPNVILDLTMDEKKPRSKHCQEFKKVGTSKDFSSAALLSFARTCDGGTNCLWTIAVQINNNETCPITPSDTSDGTWKITCNVLS